MLAAKRGISHALRISLKVFSLGANLLGHLSVGCIDGPQREDKFFDFPVIEPALLNHHPTLLVHFVIGVQFASQLPEVLASVIEIDNLNRAGEVLLGKIPDPCGAIPHYDFLLRAAPAAFPGLHIDALAKLFGGFDGAGVGGQNAGLGSDSLPCPTWFG